MCDGCVYNVIHCALSHINRWRISDMLQDVQLDYYHHIEFSIVLKIEKNGNIYVI